MEFLSIITVFVYTMGLTLGVGASTFALTFYVNALQDGVIDESERRFLHLVYYVLRIGMALIAITLLGSYFLGYPYDPAYLMQFTLLGIIIVNAILMTFRLMPMRFGPVIAGGSWYSLFLVTELPLPINYAGWLVLYVFFLAVFYAVFGFVKKTFIPTK